MKVAFLPLVLSFFPMSSCGKESSSQGPKAGPLRSDSIDRNSAGDSGDGSICQLNGRDLPCASIDGADGLGIDYLESMIDVPIKIEGSSIHFLMDKEAQSSGRRISCSTSVKAGEFYKFEIKNNQLHLTNSRGRYIMNRLNQASEGLEGAWYWKGYEGAGWHVIRHLTFLGLDRLLMRTSCEL